MSNEQYNIDVILNDSRFQAGIRNITRGLNDVDRGSRSVTTSSQQMGSTFGASIKTMMGIGAVVGGVAALGSALSGIVKTGMEYTKQMSTVEAISGSTSLQMAELGANARKLGADTVWSATNVAEAYEYMATAGWDANQMIAASKPMLDLATAGNLDLARAADIVTDTMTPFGLKAEEAQRAADVFAKGSAAANLSVEQLGETMKYAAPIADTFGMNLEETTVIAMQFANGGIKASMAGTALRAGLSRLAAPPKAAADALDTLNVSTKNADGSMKNIREIVADMSPKFNQLADSQQIAAAKAIFGEEAYAGWVMVLKNGVGEFDRMKTMLDGSAGSADAMAKIMSNNLSGAMANLSSQAENLGLVLFSRVEGGLIASTNGATGWIESLTKMIDPTGMAVEASKLLTTEQGKNRMMMQQLEQQYLAGKITYSDYIQGQRDAKTQLEANTTAQGILKQKMTELDTQLKAGMITQEQYDQKKKEAAAFSETMAQAIANEKTQQEGVNSAIQKLQEVMSVVWEAIRPIWESMTAFISQCMEKIKTFMAENGEEIKAVWNALWAVIGFVVGTIWEGIKKVIDGALNVIMGIIQVFGGILTGDWSKVWEGIKSILKGAVQIVIGIFDINFIKGILSGMARFGVSLLSSIGKTMSGFVKNIAKYISDAIRKAVQFGKDFVRSIRDGLTSLPETFSRWFGKAMDAISDINWAQVGKNIVTSIVNGIYSLAGKVGEAAAWLGDMLNPSNWFDGGAQSANAPHGYGNVGGGTLMSANAMMSPAALGGLALAPNSVKAVSLNSSAGFAKGMAALGEITNANSMSKSIKKSAPPSKPSKGNSSPTHITIETPVILDGREIARGTAKYNSQEIGQYDSRNNRGTGGIKKW